MFIYFHVSIYWLIICLGTSSVSFLWDVVISLYHNETLNQTNPSTPTDSPSTPNYVPEWRHWKRFRKPSIVPGCCFTVNTSHQIIQLFRRSRGGSLVRTADSHLPIPSPNLPICVLTRLLRNSLFLPKPLRQEVPAFFGRSNWWFLIG